MNRLFNCTSSSYHSGDINRIVQYFQERKPPNVFLRTHVRTDSLAFGVEKKEYNVLILRASRRYAAFFLAFLAMQMASIGTNIQGVPRDVYHLIFRKFISGIVINKLKWDEEEILFCMFIKIMVDIVLLVFRGEGEKVKSQFVVYSSTELLIANRFFETPCIMPHT